MEIRPMAPQDIGSFLALENSVWGSVACTEENIRSRINIFPDGQLVAVSADGQIIGYNGLQFVESLWESNYSWAKITGNGTIRTHVPSGQYMFGVSLTVNRHYPGIGAELLKAGQQMLLSQKKKGLFIGSRVPNFRENSEKYSISLWVYGENSCSFDSVVVFFQSHGFEILRIIENYFDDPDSCNYGVLMYCRAPLQPQAL